VQVLIDAGPIIAYFDQSDPAHELVDEFYEEYTGQLFTTLPVITEAVYLLRSSVAVQNELLADLAKNVYELVHLVAADFQRIAELNLKYKDLPADFADLSLVAISERLGVSKVATLDDDFNVYRRFRTDRFERVL